MFIAQFLSYVAVCVVGGVVHRLLEGSGGAPGVIGPLWREFEVPRRQFRAPMIHPHGTPKLMLQIHDT